MLSHCFPFMIATFPLLPSCTCSKWCKTNHSLPWLVVALSESLFINYWLGWFTILIMSQFTFYSLFQDIMQTHERYFPEIEVCGSHRLNLIFSLVRLPKGEIKKKKITFVRYTQSRSIHCPERWSPKSFCHISFWVIPCWFWILVTSPKTFFKNRSCIWSEINI